MACIQSGVVRSVIFYVKIVYAIICHMFYNVSVIQNNGKLAGYFPNAGFITRILSTSKG